MTPKEQAISELAGKVAGEVARLAETPADQLARLGRATAIVYERPGQPAQTLARKGA